MSADYETAWALLADEADARPATRAVAWADVRVALVELAALAAGFEPSTGVHRGVFGSIPGPVPLDRVNEVLGRFGIPPFALVDPQVARERAQAAAEERWAGFFDALIDTKERDLMPTWAERYPT